MSDGGAGAPAGAATPAAGVKHVFVSYAKKDHALAAQVVGALEAAQVEVWWDRELENNEAFSDRIEHELTTASVVVVLWTEWSVTRPFVRAEARRAETRLFQVAIGNPKLPLPFDEYQYFSVALAEPGADGAPPLIEAASLNQLVADVAKRLGEVPSVPAGDAAGSGAGATGRASKPGELSGIWLSPWTWAGPALLGAFWFLWWLPRHFTAESDPGLGVSEFGGVKMPLKFPYQWTSLASLAAAALAVVAGFAVVQARAKRKLALDWKLVGFGLTVWLLVAQFGLRQVPVSLTLEPLPGAVRGQAVRIEPRPGAPVDVALCAPGDAGACGKTMLATSPCQLKVDPGSLEKLARGSCLEALGNDNECGKVWRVADPVALRLGRSKRFSFGVLPQPRDEAEQKWLATKLGLFSGSEAVDYAFEAGRVVLPCGQREKPNKVTLLQRECQVGPEDTITLNACLEPPALSEPEGSCRWFDGDRAGVSYWVSAGAGKGWTEHKRGFCPQPGVESRVCVGLFGKRSERCTVVRGEATREEERPGVGMRPVQTCSDAELRVLCRQLTKARPERASACVAALKERSFRKGASVAFERQSVTASCNQGMGPVRPVSAGSALSGVGAVKAVSCPAGCE